MNINIDRSAGVAINLGYAQKIYAALSNIKITGDAELKETLEAFTKRVMESEELSSEAKNGILEQLAVVAEEATKPKESRRWGG